ESFFAAKLKKRIHFSEEDVCSEALQRKVRWAGRRLTRRLSVAGQWEFHVDHVRGRRRNVSRLLSADLVARTTCGQRYLFQLWSFVWTDDRSITCRDRPDETDELVTAQIIPQLPGFLLTIMDSGPSRHANEMRLKKTTAAPQDSPNGAPPV
ncbi:hypothetical protein MTO96_050546, partial [Rhipicephalus appendiculatus]